LGEEDIVVIEGNAWSDVSLFQIYRPLLLDRRIERFLRHHQILQSYKGLTMMTRTGR
jgi:hypothetical protein